MKRELLIILQAVVMLSACVQQKEPDELLNPGGVAVVTEINAEVMPFTINGQAPQPSKTTISSEGKFGWVAGDGCDRLGFWPEKSQYDSFVGSYYWRQSLFYVGSVSSDRKSATFKANGWGLLEGKKYYSYYPYDENATSSSVSIDYSGQNQLENGSTSHLGARDFMHSKVDAITGHGNTLNYSHLGSICKFNLTVPAGYFDNTFSEMDLTVDEGLQFLKSASYNPSADSVSPADLANRQYTSTFTVKFNGTSGFAPDGGELTVWAMMSPMQWNGKNVSVALTSGNKVFTGSFVPDADQQAGGGYSYTAALEFQDSATDLSLLEAANCYIVSEAGEYKFKLCKGNDKGQALSNVNSCEILWNTPANLINSNSFRIEDGYLYFNAPETFTEGNALVAAKDANGNILWSWHIWCTDAPKDQEYKNDAGFLMDRNLGALDPASAGLYYQFGRKDPFRGGDLSGESLASCSATTTVAWTVQKPTKFIAAVANSSLDWNPATIGIMSHQWSNGDSKKTLHDPCPPGYRVAEGSTPSKYGFFAKAMGKKNILLWDSNLSLYGGLVGIEKVGDVSNLKVPLKESGKYAYIPTSGYYAEAGAWNSSDNAHAFLWFDYGGGNSDPNAADVSGWNEWTSANLDCNYSNLRLMFAWNSGRAAGKNVRCQKMSQDTLYSGNGNENFGDSQSTW